MTTLLPYRLEFHAAGHEYLLDGERIPSVTQVLDASGLAGTGKAYYKPEHAQRGTAVHTATEYFDEGDLGSLDPALEGYLEGWRRFRAETGFVPTVIERQLASTQHRFAGTIDRVGLWGDGLALVDLKSGGRQRWHDLQLGGYMQLLLENQTALGLDKPLTRVGAVYVKSDGRYEWRPAENILESRNVFLSALAIRRWLRAA